MMALRLAVLFSGLCSKPQTRPNRRRNLQSSIDSTVAVEPVLEQDALAGQEQKHNYVFSLTSKSNRLAEHVFSKPFPKQKSFSTRAETLCFVRDGPDRSVEVRCSGGGRPG